jgi:hypothetical protein
LLKSRTFGHDVIVNVLVLEHDILPTYSNDVHPPNGEDTLAPLAEKPPTAISPVLLPIKLVIDDTTAVFKNGKVLIPDPPIIFDTSVTSAMFSGGILYKLVQLPSMVFISVAALVSNGGRYVILEQLAKQLLNVVTFDVLSKGISTKEPHSQNMFCMIVTFAVLNCGMVTRE